MIKNSFLRMLEAMIENPWFKNKNTRDVFIYCLMQVTNNSYSFNITLEKLSNVLELSLEETWTALKKLIDAGEITLVASKQTGTRITLDKAEKYFCADADDLAKFYGISVSDNAGVIDCQNAKNQELDILPQEKPDAASNEEKNRMKEEIKTCHNIIDYLNAKCGKKYRYSDSNNELIRARLREGFTEEDFYTVIDNKAQDWLGTNMEMYLRPVTIFCKGKFEGYLNQRFIAKKGKTAEMLDNFMNELAEWQQEQEMKEG